MKKRINGLLALLLVLITQITFAQDMTVSGIVSDSNGLPVPGANVKVKGTSVGTSTDFDGSYKIKAKSTDVLVYSFQGMNTQELKVSGTKMNARLSGKATELEGVVVTALGIKKQKRSLGYSTITVGSKDLTEVVNTNVFESLSGKLAGVDVTAPAQVGASSKIVIRGFSSLQQSGPLYIVDGSPINNSESGKSGEFTNRKTYDAGTGINDLDPSIIETMTVLKGSAATALYGPRASAGAIIITTKSGKKDQKIKIDFSSSADFSQVARVAKLQDKFGQGWLGQGYSLIGAYGLGVSAENGSWGPAFNNEIRPWGTIVNNTQALKRYNALPNNVRDFYDTGFSYTNNIRVSGGGENSVFSVGFSNVNADGIVPTDSDSFKRRTLNANAGLTSGKLDVKVNLNIANREQKIVATGSGNDSGEGATLLNEILQIPVDISAVDLKDYTSTFNNVDNYFTPYASNPYFLLNENSAKNIENRYFGNVNFTFKMRPNLFATYQIGGDYRNSRFKSYGAKVNYTPGSPNSGKAQVVGGVTEDSTIRTEFDQFLNINYNTSLTENIKLNVLAGANYNERQTNQFSASITNLDLPNIYELYNTLGRAVTDQADVLRRNYGIYSTVEANFKERIYLTLAGRQEWTSTLPAGNNKYFYPSLALSGVVLNSDKTFVKLRAAVAQTYKDANPYSTVDSFVPGRAVGNFGAITFPIGGIGAFERRNTLANPSLKAELTTEYEAGVEINLFKNRIIFDGSFYNKKTSDLIFDAAISSATGAAFKSDNNLEVSNKGVELSLGLIPFKSENFTWEINSTFTKNISNVDSIKGGATNLELTNARGVTFNAVVGQPLGVFKAFIPKLNDAGQTIVNKSTGYAETSNQQEIIGNSQRDFVLGVQNRIKYKNVTLSVAVDYKQGGDMFSESKYLTYFTGNGIETTYNDRNGFIIPNSVNEVTTLTGTFPNQIPVISYVENTTPVYTQAGAGVGVITDYFSDNKNATIAREFIFSRTFARLRDVSLTYNFSNKILKNTGLSNVSITIYGKNLAMWTPNSNSYVDPEISTYGTGILSEFGESYATPSQRTFGTSLKLTF